MDVAVECIQLTKAFDGFLAVDHIDLEVERGRVFGFLGPNGAGKTTTIRMLSCLIRPTSGSARVWGMDVATEYMEVKRNVGYLPETPGYYPEMTPEEFLMHFARLFRVKAAGVRIEEALRTLIALKSQEEVRELRGKLDWEGDLNEMREGRFPYVDR